MELYSYFNRIFILKKPTIICVPHFILKGSPAQAERCSFLPIKYWLLRNCLFFLELWRDDFEDFFLQVPLVAILWPFDVVRWIMQIV